MPEILHCRFARIDDVPLVGRLVAHSFPGPTRTPAWWEERLRDPRYGGGVDTLLLGEAGGRLVGACQLHPLRQWIAGVAFPVAGMGTVAISPVHRKQGFAAELVTAGLRAAHARGDVASALYPFRVAFYGRLGYGNAGAAIQWQIPPGVLPDAPERMRVVLLDSADGRGEAHGLYGRWARGQTGQLERSPRIWSELCTQQDRALIGYRAPDGSLEGYAFVTYRPDLPRAERYLEVNELVWTTPESRRALHAWLGSLGDQWQQLLIRTLPAHRLSDWLSEPRLPADTAPGWGLWSPAATLLMGPMFRLLDLPAAWQQRHTVEGAGRAVALEVADAQIPGNAGRWTLELEGAHANLVRGGTTMRVTLRLDVSTLSRLFIGALSPSAGVVAGLIDCDRPDLLPPLDAALVLPEPWTFDRF